MANNPKKVKDPTEVALSAIQEALNIADAPTANVEPERKSYSRTETPASDERAAPSFDLGDQSEDRSELSAAARRAANDDRETIGNLLHAILARTHVAGDLEAAVDAEAVAAGLRDEESAAIHQRLAALLARPDIAPFFAPGLRTRTEATLIDAHGHAHRPDRITTDGTVTHVLDIKTGAPSPMHHEQVALYMHLLRDLGEEHVTGHLLYVGDGILVEVDQAGTAT